MNKTAKRMTIGDIAKIAGVSPTAVSFVINNHGGIGKETREKIKAVIEATGFEPNMSSRRLSSHKSFNIALVYPATASPFSDFFYYEIARGLTERFSEEDYNVVFSRLPIGKEMQSLPNIIRRRDADGAVFFQDTDTAILSRMDETGIPYVLVDLHTPDKTHTHISVDSEQSIYTAVSYLISNGHTRIALLGSDWLYSYFVQCLAGYQRALEEYGLTIYPTWLQRGANNEQGTRECMNTILAAPVKPTAICCMGDIHAMTAINFAKTKGLQIPDELSFISIDDIILSQFIDPPLTTIGYDKRRMGLIAAELLLRKISGNDAESVIVDSTTVIERNSVKPLHSYLGEQS